MRKKPKIATYTSIYNYIYNGDERTSDDKFKEFDSDSQKAFEVIQMFKYRRGFEAWWNGIEEDIGSAVQNDIFKNIRKIITCKESSK